jgi:hypothetical protein
MVGTQRFGAASMAHKDITVIAAGKAVGTQLSEGRRMNAEAEKSQREKCVFRAFINKSGLEIDPDSFESRRPPEPDILCRHNRDGKLAFELVEICNEDLARKISTIGKEDFGFVRSSDPSANAIRKKLKKDYHTEYPVDLLCYTSGRVISPDAVIIEAIRSVIDMNSRQFCRIWLLGDQCHLVWPVSQ